MAQTRTHRLSSNRTGWRSGCLILSPCFFLATCGVAQQAVQPPGDLAAMDLEQLMTIKVTTASRFSDKLAQAPSIMSVVTSDELRRFGGMTLGEILDRVTGLTQSSQYFTDRNLVAADGDQTKTSGAHILFLINGRPTREVLEGGIISDLLESFPVEILERIEVIRGPGSVLYGSNAFSAVINLIPRKADRNQAAVEGLLGPDDAAAASGHFLYQQGAFTMAGASQVHKLPDWSLVYLVPPPLRNVPGAPTEPPIKSVTQVDRGTGDYFGIDYKGLALTSLFTESQATSFTQGSVGESRLTRDFANLGYARKVRSQWDMEFNTTYTRTTFGITAYPSIQRDSNEFLAEWTNLIKLTSKDRLTVGALFSRIAGTEWSRAVSPSVMDAGGSRPAGGFYAQLDHQWLPEVKLIAGFQSNKFAATPLSTVPRFGAVWSPTAALNVKVLYGKAFRPASITETTVNLPDIQGNPKLVPETVGTFQAAAYWQTSRLQLGADYFHSHQSNSIETVSHAPIEYRNVNGVTFNGVEAETKYYVSKEVFAQGSLLYQRNHDQTGTTQLTPIPDFGFKAGASYRGDRGLELGLFDVSDGKPKPYPFTINPLTGWRHSLNAQLSQDVSRYLHLPEKNAVVVAAHGNDLLNQTVWLPGFGFSSIDTIPVQKGRTIYAGLQFSRGRH